jgi:bleomycin hydrolase
MKIKLITSLIIIAVIAGSSLFADDTRNKGKFIEYKNPFWQMIKDSTEAFDKKQDEKPKKLSFKVDFEGIELPESKDEFTQFWHNAPVSQGWTGTCWCFSTSSFLESEIKRINGTEVKLSELYTVYCEYIEKARRYVQERGDSHFAEGSQANAVTRMWKKYGCMPAEAFTGLKDGREYHDHHKMSGEMKKYLESVKADNAWNEEVVLTTIKNIMDHYIGTPPASFTYNGKIMTPMQFMNNVCKLNMDDYVDLMSLMTNDYWSQCEHDVPDNWWNSDIYFNVPLDEYMEAVKSAVKNGYSMFIGGDVSESGYYSFKDAAVIPSYDIPSDYIDENARQFRYSNKTTTDDHGIHVVGYLEKDDTFWFLIKDSGSGARNGNNPGYYFYHEDYIKLKIMNFMVHRSAVEDLLKKFK